MRLRARLAGVLRGSIPNRSLSGEAHQVASTSQVSRRPQSILEWHHQLSLPATASDVLFTKFHDAIQAPFPPLKEPFAWIEAHDVEKTIEAVFAKAKQPKALETKNNLDSIVRGIERCHEDAKKRLTFRVEQDCMKQGVHLSEAAVHARVSSHPTIKSWRRILRSHYLLNNRFLQWSQSVRRPNRDDILDAVRTLDVLHPANSRPRISQKKMFRYYNHSLTLLARQIPTLEEKGKVFRFLAHKAPLSQLQVNISEDATRSEPLQRLEDLLPSEEGEEQEHEGVSLSMPQDSLRLIEEIWSRITRISKPNSHSYGTLLLIETKLAPWRAILSDSDDAWEPIRRLMTRLETEGHLQTSHVNQVMWAILRYDPNSTSGNDDNEHDYQWPSSDYCLELYEEMRGNTVQVEMQWERMLDARANGKATLPIKSIYQQGRLAGSSSSSLLPKLPLNIFPSQRTYELLIRGLAWRGKLQRAIGILNDMTQTPSDSLERFRRMSARGKKSGSWKKEDETASSPTFQASVSTYDGIFRAFCKNGIPSNLVNYNPTEPERSLWEPVEQSDVSNAWNIDSLRRLFESFLDLDPKMCNRIEQGYLVQGNEDEEVLEPTQQSREGIEVGGMTIAKEGGEAQEKDWLIKSDDMLLHSWISIVSGKDDLVANRKDTCNAPTTQQLFNLLTALRRTSNDDAQWVLSQWERVVEKFGSGVKRPKEGGTGNIAESSSEKNLPFVNKEGWTKWKLNNRLERVIAFLQEKQKQKLSS